MRRFIDMNKLKAAILAASLFLSIDVSLALESDIIKPQDITDLNLSVICQACHERIYDEWSQSMHSKSIPTKDPIVGGFYKYLEARKIDTGRCGKCHDPFHILYPNEPESRRDIFAEGVNCVFCHSVRQRQGGPEQRHGIDAFKLDFVNGLAGPTEVTQTRFHDTACVPIFRTVEFCAGCHQEGESDYGAKAKTQLQCQYCHMPSKQQQKSASASKARDKVFRHYFEGGHSGDLLGMTAMISGEATRKEGKSLLNISVENSASHSIPTGFPLRAIYLKVTALNKDKEAVWSNYKKDPFLEDPKGYFALILPKGEELPAHYAKDVKPLADQRLGGMAVRELSYESASPGITAFKVQLYYRLLPKNIIKDLKLDESLAPEVLMVEEIFPVK